MKHNEKTIMSLLIEAITAIMQIYPPTSKLMPKCVKTFKEAGIITEEKGLVLAMQNGSEFQVTIKLSKVAR